MDYDLTRTARTILQTLKYVTLATADGTGKPWNTPVTPFYGPDLSLYWFSAQDSQHSRNIRANPDVFTVAYDSTVPVGQGRAVYLEAAARELTDPAEIGAALRIRFGDDGPAGLDGYQDDAVQRVYQAVPTKAWVNSAEVRDGVFIRHYRIEIPLDRLGPGV